MADKIENIDSPNDEEKDIKGKEGDEPEGDEPEDTDDVGDLKKQNQSLYEQLKKAKGYERDGEGKWIKKPKPVEIKPKVPVPTPKDADIDSILEAKLEKRDLDALDLSDELKKEVSTYAKVQGISVKKALQSDYISFLKEKEEKKEKIDNASLGSKRKSVKKDYSEMKASDFDLKTPEGKADFAKYEQHLREQLG